MANLDVMALAIAVPIKVERPLCVDLDGTLVKSDTLADSLMVLARRHPAAFLRVPSWAMKGRAHLKSRVTGMVALDVAHLPYNRPLLDYLREEYAAGRSLVLATEADCVLARRIADHLGIFDDVLASDGEVNLTGKSKLQYLDERFLDEGFDYIGNALPDVPLLQSAKQAMLANPHLGLIRALKNRNITVSRGFQDRSCLPVALAKALRVHQWAKNLLVFVPLLLGHSFGSLSFLAAIAAFFCFSLTASATYILNDLLDLEPDRVHLNKRKRAFAAGDLSVTTGIGISFLMTATALSTAAYLPRRFLIYLLLYLATTIAYSLAFKRIVLVDVVVLSSLYTIRMLAGAAATQTPISPWLAAFSTFLFLSLAMVKRFSELRNLSARGMKPSNGRGYLLSDVEQLRSFGTSSAYASVVVFALYISGNGVVELYHHAQRLWLTTPMMILWLSRVWLLASRGLLDEDPVVFALTDRTSLLLGVGVLLVALSAV